MTVAQSRIAFCAAVHSSHELLCLSDRAEGATMFADVEGEKAETRM